MPLIGQRAERVEHRGRPEAPPFQTGSRRSSKSRSNAGPRPEREQLFRVAQYRAIRNRQLRERMPDSSASPNDAAALDKAFRDGDGPPNTINRSMSERETRATAVPAVAHTPPAPLVRARSPRARENGVVRSETPRLSRPPSPRSVASVVRASRRQASPTTARTRLRRRPALTGLMPTHDALEYFGVAGR